MKFVHVRIIVIVNQ